MQEAELKLDLINESRANNNHVVLHDEIVNADGSFTLEAHSQLVKEDSIYTPKELFQKVADESFAVSYARVPITDEQAPIDSIFGQLEERAMEALQQHDANMTFNCQLGRGRTTTVSLLRL